MHSRQCKTIKLGIIFYREKGEMREVDMAWGDTSFTSTFKNHHSSLANELDG